jgi:hypothetical protein
MSPVVVKGNVEAAAALKSFGITTAGTEFADTVTPTIIEALRKEAPYRAVPPGSDDEDHVHLRDSFLARRTSALGSVQLTFYSTVKQATFLLNGTRGHGPSTPGVQALHWIDDDGDDVFAKYVRGITKNRFNERAWATVEAVVIAELVEILKGTLDL